jgi:hypothetical protein
MKNYREKTLTVKDSFTGFIGIVTGHADYLTGCDQYLVQPPAKDGEWKEGRWFDEKRLVVVSEGEQLIISPMADDNGADIEAPVK